MNVFLESMKQGTPVDEEDEEKRCIREEVVRPEKKTKLSVEGRALARLQAHNVVPLRREDDEKEGSFVGDMVITCHKGRRSNEWRLGKIVQTDEGRVMIHTYARRTKNETDASRWKFFPVWYCSQTKNSYFGVLQMFRITLKKI